MNTDSNSADGQPVVQGKFLQRISAGSTTLWIAFTLITFAAVKGVWSALVYGILIWVLIGKFRFCQRTFRLPWLSWFNLEHERTATAWKRGSVITALSICFSVLVFGSSGKPPSSTASMGKLPVKEQIRRTFEEKLNEDKQKIFDAFYPVGEALNVVVHDVAIEEWKNGEPSENFEDVIRFTARYTLYWKSPLISDGYTKFRHVHDMETKAVASCEILMSNANVTNKDIGEAALSLGGTLLFNALNN